MEASLNFKRTVGAINKKSNERPLPNPVRSFLTLKPNFIMATDCDFHGVKQSFLDKHHKQPDFYVSSPASVTLIGDQLDNSNFPAISMAVNRKVKVAIGISDELSIGSVSQLVSSLNCSENDKDWVIQFESVLKALPTNKSITAVLENEIPEV